MTPSQLVEHARAIGIVLTAAGSRLDFEAPAGLMTKGLRERLAEQRAAILDLLAAEQREAWSCPGKWCKS